MKLTNVEAIQAQGALKELGAREDIPIRASLDVALISNQIDTQVKAYGVVLQNLYKKYSVRAEPNESGGVQFTCTLEDETQKKESLEAFAEKLNDLLEANTGDLNFRKIKLPEDITIKPETLKALTEFVEIG